MRSHRRRRGLAVHRHRRHQTSTAQAVRRGILLVPAHAGRDRTLRARAGPVRLVPAHLRPGSEGDEPGRGRRPRGGAGVQQVGPDGRFRPAAAGAPVEDRVQPRDVGAARQPVREDRMAHEPPRRRDAQRAWNPGTSAFPPAYSTRSSARSRPRTRIRCAEASSRVSCSPRRRPRVRRAS